MILKHINQIRALGFVELRRKLFLFFKLILNFVFFLLSIPLSFLILIIIRAIKPILLIRLGTLVSWRIGHFAGNTDLYICEKKAGINSDNLKTIDIWCNRTKACNKQLNKMWKREINILPKWLVYPVFLLNNFFPGGTSHQIPNTRSSDRDVLNLTNRHPNLSFTANEEIEGREFMKKLGINPSSKFVCLTVRDSAYLEQQKKETRSGVDWSYHNYRDSDIEDYSLAIQELVNLGYYVIRMGVLVNRPINIKSKKVIDYAFNHLRTDFMDVYLASKCSFCISTSTGFDALPSLFRRPLVIVNNPHIEFFYSFYPETITIFKKIFDNDINKFLSIKSIINRGIGKFDKSKQFKALNLDLIDNSPEEIKDAVLEIILRTSGKWEDTWYDKEVSGVIKGIYRNSTLNGRILSRFGTQFLRENIYLIND